MEDDNAWVFDSLICFLNGPEWNAPLQSFIEEKSLIFEADGPDHEEHMKIYEEFKNLVDFMLGNFMEDLGITPQQFEDACNRQHTRTIPISFDQNLFELIWAANDYRMFQRMMCQRNVELQLQALELIERKYGKMPRAYIPHGSELAHDDVAEATSGEETNNKEQHHHRSMAEEKIMEEVVENFPEPEPSTSKEETVQYIQKEKAKLESTLKAIGNGKGKSKQLKVKISDTSTIIPNSNDINAKKTEIKPPNKVEKIVEIFDNKIPTGEIDQIELKKRQEYLRAQRDKLVALKKDIRKKHLNVDQEVPEKTKMRPKSSRAAAKAILTGNTPNIEPQQLELRKTLVERLKSEVIHGSDDAAL